MSDWPFFITIIFPITITIITINIIITLKRWVFLARLSTKVISNGSGEENGKGSTWTVWKFLQHNTGHSFNLQLHLVRSPLVASITLLQDLILHWSWYSWSYSGLLLLILHVRVWAPISHYGQLVQRTRVLLRHLHDTALAYERYTPTALHNEETVHVAYRTGRCSGGTDLKHH